MRALGSKKAIFRETDPPARSRAAARRDSGIPTPDARGASPLLAAAAAAGALAAGVAALLSSPGAVKYRAHRAQISRDARAPAGGQLIRVWPSVWPAFSLCTSSPKRYLESGVGHSRFFQVRSLVVLGA